MNSNAGFTMIELMIVTLIIGVLTSIALPLYKEYIAKSQVATALSSVSGIKVGVATYKYDNGVCTGTSTYYDKDVNNLMSSPQSVIGSVDVTDNGDNCVISVQLNNNVSQKIQGKHLDFTVNFDSSGSSAWECSSPDIDEVYLPPGCK